MTILTMVVVACFVGRSIQVVASVAGADDDDGDGDGDDDGRVIGGDGDDRSDPDVGTESQVLSCPCSRSLA